VEDFKIYSIILLAKVLKIRYFSKQLSNSYLPFF